MVDLKIKDVAGLFNVSETTVERWISDGKIPTYRINKLNPDYRFSVHEMEEWLISHKLTKSNEGSPFKSTRSEKTILDKDSKNSAGQKQFSLFRAIHKGDVLNNVPGKTKEEVIRNTMRKVAKSLHLDAEVLTELLLDREKMMPTSLNNGIGVPHTRESRLDDNQDIVLVVSPAVPLDYGAMDGKPVHTLFFLFACDDKRHLHLLAKIAHLSSHPQLLDVLKTNPSKDALLTFIKNWESTI